MICGPFVPKAVKIGFDLGVPGTYVATATTECRGGAYCLSRSGTFSSDDGKVVRTDVYVRDKLPKGWKDGDRVRAFDVGDPDEVYTSEMPDSWPVPIPIVLSPLGLVSLGRGLEHTWRNRN